jgi:hypothetical protein
MKQKTKHDQKVSNVARGYRAQGYSVRADIPGYKPPSNVGGRRPDIYAWKGRDKVMVEVETPSSLRSDSGQRSSLRRSAHRRNARFRTVLTKGKRRLK